MQFPIIHCCLIFVSLCNAQPFSLDCPAAAGRLALEWRQRASEISAIEARNYSRRIANCGALNDRALIGTLLEIAEFGSASRISRRLALETACSLSAEDAAIDIVRLIQGWVADYKAVRTGGKGLGLHVYENAALLKDFIRFCASDLMVKMDNQEPLVRLFAQMGLSDFDRTSYLRYRLIAECNVPLAKRRQLIVEMIREAPAADVPVFLSELLTEDDLPAIRDLVRPVEDPNRWHYTAGGVLAHLGDGAALPHMKRQRDITAISSLSIARRIDRLIRRIQIQNPPRRLLLQIRMPDSKKACSPEWLVRRASAQLPQDEVRAAVLWYLMNRAGATVSSGYLSATIEAGIEEGVITEHDVKSARIEYKPFDHADRPW